MTLFTAFTLSQMALWSLIDLLASIPPKIEISPKEWEGYRDDYTQFSLNYFKVAINSAPSRNVLVSPLSFGMILSMIHQGTYGESSDQISKVMGLTQEESRKIFYNITHSLRVSFGKVGRYAALVVLANFSSQNQGRRQWGGYGICKEFSPLFF